MRAARDLLARVPLASARLVYDLGCGPGNSAGLLTNRFPGARITGVDTSEAMLDHARRRAPNVRFVQQDITDWTPDEGADLIYANGALQFLPDHHELFPRLASMLAQGGVFAVQMPSAARESSHALMRMVAAEGPWWSRLAPVVKSQPLIAEDYYEWLRPVCSRIELWSTTYVYAFDGADGIVDWFAGSPLQALPGAALERRAKRIPRPISQGAARRLSDAVGRQSAVCLSALVHCGHQRLSRVAVHGRRALRFRRDPVQDLGGSRVAGPYHFPAQIQSFQDIAAPFPGFQTTPPSVRRAMGRPRRVRRNRTIRRSPSGRLRRRRRRQMDRAPTAHSCQLVTRPAHCCFQRFQMVRARVRNRGEFPGGVSLGRA